VTRVDRGERLQSDYNSLWRKYRDVLDMCDELLAVCTELAEAAERDRLSEMVMADKFYAAATQRDEALALVRGMADLLDSAPFERAADNYYADNSLIPRAQALLKEGER